MQFQFNTDNHISGTATLSSRVEGQLRDRLDRFTDRLTRLEVHVSDENGAKSHGEDINCRVEARIQGDRPLSASARADSIDAAASQAGNKMAKMLERHFGKQDRRR